MVLYIPMPAVVVYIPMPAVVLYIPMPAVVLYIPMPAVVLYIPMPAVVLYIPMPAVVLYIPMPVHTHACCGSVHMLWYCTYPCITLMVYFLQCEPALFGHMDVTRTRYHLQ